MMQRKIKSQNVIRLGMLFLVIASLSLRLHPSARFSADLLDSVKGLFYGLAIATLLLGVRMNVRDKKAGRCA